MSFFYPLLTPRYIQDQGGYLQTIQDNQAHHKPKIQGALFLMIVGVSLFALHFFQKQETLKKLCKQVGITLSLVASPFFLYHTFRKISPCQKETCSNPQHQTKAKIENLENRLKVTESQSMQQQKALQELTKEIQALREELPFQEIRDKTKELVEEQNAFFQGEVKRILTQETRSKEALEERLTLIEEQFQRGQNTTMEGIVRIAHLVGTELSYFREESVLQKRDQRTLDLTEIEIALSNEETLSTIPGDLEPGKQEPEDQDGM